MQTTISAANRICLASYISKLWHQQFIRNKLRNSSSDVFPFLVGKKGGGGQLDNRILLLLAKKKKNITDTEHITETRDQKHVTVK